MPIRFIDCFVVSTDVKHDAYKKKDPASSQGLEQDRVKIKTTQVRDCRRVSVANEEMEKTECGDKEFVIEEEETELEGEEEDLDPLPDNAKTTMQTLMENFRSFCERSK